jgi:hypothetical protein
MTSTTDGSRESRIQSEARKTSRLNRLARVAGILYLAIFVIYPPSTVVWSMLVVPGDAAATAQNRRSSRL